MRDRTGFTARRRAARGARAGRRAALGPTDRQPGSTPHASTPHASTPHASTPHASTPHASTPHASTPHASTPHASTPHASTPHASTPHAVPQPVNAGPAGDGPPAGPSPAAGRWPRGPRVEGPLRRRMAGRVAGGVAAGLAGRAGLDVRVVRVAFAVLTLVSGVGAAAYVAAWLLLPADDSGGTIASRALTDRRGIALAAGLASLMVVVLLIASALGASWLDSLSWPAVITLAGLVLIWRNASPEEQLSMGRVAGPALDLAADYRRSRIAARTAVAATALAAGLVTVLAEPFRRAVLLPLGGVALIVAALVLLLGPWWIRIARDLVTERQARIRAEERADMASRVHDSVLQTLALIQRRADDPQQVVQLARAQERELRGWLFDGRAPGSLDGQATTLGDGVRLIQQEVEARHGVPVEAVTVGDCPLDDAVGAMLAAAREACVNAVKWSGAPVVSLFAEVEPAEVTVFVRDRGRGFDPAAVPGDRKGLAESICGRMARRGGAATVRSAPGEGTEVTLRMPRLAGQREPGAVRS